MADVEPVASLEGGALEKLVGDDSNRDALTKGLLLDPGRDDHKSVLDELAAGIPFIDFETGAAKLVTVKVGDVPVSVEVQPTLDSVSLLVVGKF